VKPKEATKSHACYARFYSPASATRVWKRHGDARSGDELFYGFSATTLPFFQK
jgi:hypothetical protein